MSEKFILASTKPKEKPPVELELADDSCGFLVLRAKGDYPAPNILEINKKTGQIGRRSSVNPDLGFELNARGEVVIH